MAKKKKAQAPKKTRAELMKEEATRQKRTRIAMIVFAAVAAAAILTLAVIGIVSAVLDRESADYNDPASLKKYIRLDREDYIKYSATVKLDPVDDVAVENALIQALYSARASDPEYGSAIYSVGSTEPKRPLAAGDTAYIYYIGYELGEGGEKIYFDGGCNFGGNSSELALGSGSLIPGFELGLIGKNPWSFSQLKKITSGKVSEGDVVSFTMTAMYSDGSTAQQQTFVTVADAAICDKTYGSGFADFLIGKDIGKLGEDEKFTTSDVSDKSGKSVYTDISIDAVYDLGELPLTVEARFPYSYREESLAGKTVRFDVYVEKVQYYKTPAIDEQFIKDKLDMSAEEIAKFGKDGDSIEDCYRGYLKSNLVEQANTEAEEIIEEAFYAHVLERVKVKRLPRADVNSYYNYYLALLTDNFNNQSGSSLGGNFSDIDSYATAFFNLEKGEDWQDYLLEAAEKKVTADIILYYVMDKEGFYPPDDEYNELYEQAIRAEIEATLIAEKKDINSITDEEYQRYRDLFMSLDGYGDEYFKAVVLEEYATAKIIAMAEIKYE